MYISLDDNLKFITFPNDLTVLEGHQTAKLACRSSDPSNKITWLKV